MVEKIIEFLTEGEDDYFVVVGAAHMVGRDGIVKLLIKAGYKVERIK
ncbi:MAG: TraB/GumN family protein [Oscillospiraceae bacterium]|nr:TraB/GumN family protein [Oscillospiraceae bacterium]